MVLAQTTIRSLQSMIFICFFIWMSTAVSSQNSNLQIDTPAFNSKEDSLLHLVTVAGHDSLKMVLFDQLRRIKIYDDPQKALEYTRLSGHHALLSGNERMYHISLVYEGNAFFGLGQYEDALEKFLEAEKYFNQTGETRVITSIYNALGAVYENTGRDSLAILYFNQSFEMAEKGNDLARQIYALNNMSNIHFQKGRYEESKSLLLKVMEYPKEAFMPDFYNMSKANLANTLRMTDPPNVAEELYVEILEEKDQLDQYTRCMAEKGLGNIRLKLNKPVLAVQSLQNALQIAALQGFRKEQRDILFDLSTAYRLTDQHKEAYTVLSEFLVLKDSILDEEKDKNLIEALTRFETEKKEKEIELLTANNALKDLKIKQSNMMLIGLILLTISLVSILVLAYRNQRNKSKAHAILQEKNSQISKALDEKNILLREIHHRVKNNLQVISSLLKLQSHYIQDENAIKAIAEGRNRVNSMALLHQNLYKEDNLTGVDMKEYFTNLVEGLFETYNIHDDQILLTTHIEPLHLDIDTVIPLGLIANELISNALKHAFNDRNHAELFISLVENEEKLIFTVKDNGIGYHPEQPGIQKSFGHKLIQSLAEKLEAEWNIQNVGGTEVSLIINDYTKAA
ncbi:MAG TPA: histidine kinase dimerization/phosphoacceptor domain -containing protein [Saprospiraceae bacterium]|nr:histidine kinase dimerization/phosphoacceptor domain -containing protein [Saprospiraceae bacterium]